MGVVEMERSGWVSDTSRMRSCEDVVMDWIGRLREKEVIKMAP